MKRLSFLITCTVMIGLLVTSIPSFGHSHKVKSTDGVELVFTHEGKTLKKGDPTLVFVHCWCCNRKFWKNQFPVFAKKYRVIALDLAGHGDSGKDRKKYTIDAYAQDVATVIKELKLKKVILIGHSMGGPVSIVTASLLPKTVIGVVGVDTLHNLEQKYPEQQKKAFMAQMKENFPNTVKFMLNMMFPDNADPKVKEKIVKAMSSAAPRVGIESMDSIWSMDVAAAVKKANVPVRCVNADLFPTNLEIGKKHAKSFDAKIIKGAGHFPQIEKPELFNKLLMETIEELAKL